MFLYKDIVKPQVLILVFTATYHQHSSLSDISLLPGLIVDHTGSYVPAFYMSSAVAMASFLLILMILIPINRKKSKVHPQDKMEEDAKMDKAGSEVIENQNKDRLKEIPC